MTRDWPQEIDGAKRNPYTVENWLKKYIKDSRVTLLGELDFDLPVNYEGLDWSLRDLALRNISHTQVKNEIDHTSKDSFTYPATLAIWSVSRAQEASDGNSLWADSGFANKNLGKLFARSLELLDLEIFPNKLDGMQAYMGLARIHSIIPNFAMDEFCRTLRNAKSQHLSSDLSMQKVHDRNISVAVSKMIEEKPYLAKDLIERCLQTLYTNEIIGLPPRIALYLLEGNSKETSGRKSLIEAPAIKIDRAQGEIYAQGMQNWVLESDQERVLDSENIPPLTLFASSGTLKVKLFDVNDGYLIFNQEDFLIDNFSIPKSGAVILWNRNVLIDENLLSTDPEFMSGKWAGWKYAVVHQREDFKITINDSEIRHIGLRRELVLLANSIPWLKSNNYDVYSQSPELESSQDVNIVDNLTRKSTRLHAADERIKLSKSGYFDLSIYGSLGRSYESLSGCVIPELSVTGSLLPLLPGETRTLNFAIGEDWSIDKSVEIKSNFENGEVLFPKFQVNVNSPDGVRFEIEIDPEFFHWSIEFHNEAPVVFYKSSQHLLSNLCNLEKIVLNGVGAETPTLFIDDSDGKKGARAIDGSKFENRYSFNLSALKDSIHNEKVTISTTIFGKRIQLMEFIPKKKRTVIRDLSELAVAAIEAGFFTDEQWADFAVKQKEEAKRLNRTIRANRR